MIISLNSIYSLHLGVVSSLLYYLLLAVLSALNLKEIDEVLNCWSKEIDRHPLVICHMMRFALHVTRPSRVKESYRVQTAAGSHLLETTKVYHLLNGQHMRNFVNKFFTHLTCKQSANNSQQLGMIGATRHVSYHEPSVLLSYHSSMNLSIPWQYYFLKTCPKNQTFIC